MKGIILYSSRYGATKRYADWLQEETGFDIAEASKADIAQVEGYDTVVFGGGIYASSISGLSFLRKNISRLQGKKVIVFCVGASPYDEKAFRLLTARSLKDGLTGLPCFYLRGAWNYPAMSFTDRALCRLLQSSVQKKAPETLEPWEKALMEAGKGTCDWTDRASLTPILEAVRQNG